MQVCPRDVKDSLGPDATQLDVDFEKSKKDKVDKGLYAVGKFVEKVTGYTPTKEDAEAREAAEKDASQWHMDFEFKDPEKITEDEIKVDQVIEDLQSKNVYIEGVGYIPLASLMSPRDDIVV